MARRRFQVSLADTDMHEAAKQLAMAEIDHALLECATALDYIQAVVPNRPSEKAAGRQT
jgi:hypothetical protein